MTYHSEESSSNSSVFNTEQQTVEKSLGTVSHALEMHENHVCLVKFVHIIISLGNSIHEQSVSNGSPDSEKVQDKPEQNVVLVIIS